MIKKFLKKLKNLRSEFVIAAEGVVRKRGGAINEDLATGDIEVTVNTLAYFIRI